jgi:hypothetical protein
MSVGDEYDKSRTPTRRCSERLVRITADDALLLLDCLQEHAPDLRAMLDEEAVALAVVEQRALPPDTGAPPRPSQAEDDRATIEESLREHEV